MKKVKKTMKINLLKVKATFKTN